MLPRFHVLLFLLKVLNGSGFKTHFLSSSLPSDPSSFFTFCLSWLTSRPVMNQGWQILTWCKAPRVDNMIETSDYCRYILKIYHICCVNGIWWPSLNMNYNSIWLSEENGKSPQDCDIFVKQPGNSYTFIMSNQSPFTFYLLYIALLNLSWFL